MSSEVSNGMFICTILLYGGLLAFWYMVDKKSLVLYVQWCIGADALAAAVGGGTCDKEGMDEKVADCLGGLEAKVNDLMTAIVGPEGGNGTLEDQITLVLVKKGVISCEGEEQCDDNKQCLKQPDGMSRCQNPCERPDIIR